MASTFQNRSDWITEVRQASTKILDGIDELEKLSQSWDRGINIWLIDASGNDPTQPDYEPNDFSGSNEGLIKQDMVDVVGTTLSALQTLLSQGNGTNLEKVRL